MSANADFERLARPVPRVPLVMFLGAIASFGAVIYTAVHLARTEKQLDEVRKQLKTEEDDAVRLRARNAEALVAIQQLTSMMTSPATELKTLLARPEVRALSPADVARADIHLEEASRAAREIASIVPNVTVISADPRSEVHIRLTNTARQRGFIVGSSRQLDSGAVEPRKIEIRYFRRSSEVDAAEIAKAIRSALPTSSADLVYVPSPSTPTNYFEVVLPRQPK